MDKLTVSDQRNLKFLLERLIQMAQDGELTTSQCAGAIQHVISAAALGNLTEVKTWANDRDRVIGNLVDAIVRPRAESA